MADERKLYSAATIIVAARDLQDAAGSTEKPIQVPDDELYTLGHAIALLSTEIRILRERGFSNERIADLFTGFEIEATAADIEKFYERSHEEE
ncbi:MAG: hypothetical protein ABI197_09550 [Granulicella sp.]